MTKKQLWTYISGGILNLFVLGSITSCGGMYQGNTGAVKNGWENKRSGTDKSLVSVACNSKTFITTNDYINIFVSNDNGNSWNIKTDNNNFINLRKIACNGNTWMATNNSGGCFKSTDSGNSWTLTGTFVYGSYLLACNSSKWIATSPSGIFYESTDNGNTWNKKNMNITINGALPFYNGFACDGNTWVAVGYGNEITLSIDNGNTWMNKSVPASTFAAVAGEGGGNG